jgi:putative FmdB family regulatory protein
MAAEYHPMPIYEFECRACHRQFEHLVLPWIKEEAAPTCPSCQATDVERVVSLCAVSSEATRQASLAKARKRNSAVQKEKEHEEFKQMIEHANEHH